MLQDQLIELIECNQIDEFRTRLAQIPSKELEEILNSPDSCDNYIIHAAIKLKNISLINWLLDIGADPKLKNYWGSNALILAKKFSFDEAIQLLESHSSFIKTETEEVLIDKGLLDKNNETTKKSNERIVSLAKPTSNTQKSIASLAGVDHKSDERSTVENTNKLLKKLLISNVITAVVALGSLYFSYQAMNSADWAGSEARDASDKARDAADSAAFIKNWGVDCN